ncbi:hypothetical protein DL95DRAFT_506059 [Leptodontidium sp. 2 PMI_412]|nr:hypothetical protein DL95DRAFT_506059 [Leptodontidium sp. 2 PMI_412]
MAFSSSTTVIEPLLATTMRILRKLTTVDNIIASWPSFKEKSLSLPPTLTDHERRLYFDLPNEDTERSNIRAAADLSREQLIEKTVSNREQLTTQELTILMRRFWTSTTPEENELCLEAMGRTSEEA